MPTDVRSFFHPPTGTFSYVVADPATRRAAVIDPVLDYDPSSGALSTDAAGESAAHVSAHDVKVAWILETHAHADHLSAGRYLSRQLGGTLAIGEGIRAVQNTFRKVFNLDDFAADGSQFDRLLADGDVIRIGSLDCEVLATPGHTSDSVTYVAGDAAFVGDTLFMPGYGTARCDFPGADAARLYDSIARILALPDSTRIFSAHDYPRDGAPPRSGCTVAEQREANVHLQQPREAYVKMREARDRKLAVPRLLLPAIQVNIRGGELPSAEDNGVSYLKIPLRGAGVTGTDEL